MTKKQVDAYIQEDLEAQQESIAAQQEVLERDLRRLQRAKKANDETLAEVGLKLLQLSKLRDEVKALGGRGGPNSMEGAFLRGRRSLARELSESGGLSEGRYGLEILYLLPDSFVEFYAKLFHRALTVGDSSVMGGQGKENLEKAKGNPSMVLGSDNQLQAKGSGKKYRQMGLVVGSEKALKVKEGVDRMLAEAVSSGLQALAQDSGEGEPGSPGLSEEPARTQRQCTGKLVEAGKGAGEVARIEKPCRAFLKASWKWCPMCGTPVK